MVNFFYSIHSGGYSTHKKIILFVIKPCAKGKNTRPQIKNGFHKQG